MKFVLASHNRKKLAEMQGFEPREDLRPRLISSQVH